MTLLVCIVVKEEESLTPTILKLFLNSLSFVLKYLMEELFVYHAIGKLQLGVETLIFTRISGP